MQMHSVSCRVLRVVAAVVDTAIYVYVNLYAYLDAHMHTDSSVPLYVFTNVPKHVSTYKRFHKYRGLRTCLIKLYVCMYVYTYIT